MHRLKPFWYIKDFDDAMQGRISVALYYGHGGLQLIHVIFHAIKSRRLYRLRGCVVVRNMIPR